MARSLLSIVCPGKEPIITLSIADSNDIISVVQSYKCDHNTWQYLAFHLLDMNEERTSYKECTISICEEVLEKSDIRCLSYYTSEIMDECNYDHETGHDSGLSIVQCVIMSTYLKKQKITSYSIVEDEDGNPFLRWEEKED